MPVPGTKVLFCIWETRVQDYEKFSNETRRAWSKLKYAQTGLYPAGLMGRNGAVAFCDWLTNHERASGGLPAAGRYRLPTEPEWLAAARSGDRSTGITTVPALANLSGEESIQTGRPHIPGHRDDFPYTAPVGSFPPDANGLFDLHGNVWEWTLNAGKADSKSGMLRGHGFGSDLKPPSWMLAQSHHWADAKGEGDGFRCVLELTATSATGQQATPASASIPASSLPSGSAASALTTATKEKPFINSLGMKFVPVPGTKALFCIHETRIKDYETFALSNKVDGSWKKAKQEGILVAFRPDYPVAAVNWEDASAFCMWLTQTEMANGLLPQHMKYRLPQDEEWSRAVGLDAEVGETFTKKSGGNSTHFPWGATFPPSEKAGNYADQAFHEKFPETKYLWLQDYADGFPTTAPVMSFQANILGIHDLGGNVLEWCEEPTDRLAHLFRGSSFMDAERENLLSSKRRAGWTRKGSHGFRVVLELSAP